jgi:VanZ family protein
VPALVWTALIFFLTLLPPRDVPDVSFFSRIPYFDKLVHAGLFLGFVVCWSWGFYKNKKNFHLFRLLWVIAVLGILLGIAIEYLQRYTGRDFDFWDMAADTAGAFIAVIFILLVWAFLRKKQPTR